MRAWTVNLNGRTDDAQVTYKGTTTNYGLDAVYNGGTFFFGLDYTPTESDFTFPEVQTASMNKKVTIDATNHAINVDYYYTTVTLIVQTSGTNPYPDLNTRIGTITTNKNGTKETTTITTTSGLGTTSFNPGGPFSVTASNIYRGIGTPTVSNSDGTYTVTFPYDEANEAQYMAYNPLTTGDDWLPHRIPAITRASNGDLLAVYDYRTCGKDIGYGDVDLILRRSSDNGKTWTDEQTIANGAGGSSNVFGVGYGDAALVADRESGKVVVICVSGKQVYANATSSSKPFVARVTSDDYGKTWSTPEDITNNFWYTGTEPSGSKHILQNTESGTAYEAYAGFFGAGRIVQSNFKKSGSDYYRLYAAMLCRGNNISGAYVVYSDDFGATWELLNNSLATKPSSSSNEPKVEILPNGQLVLSGRKAYGRYYNIFTFEDEASGTGTWSSEAASNSQTGGIKNTDGTGTNGEIYVLKAKKPNDDTVYDVVLQSLPKGSGRSNVEIWYKDITANASKDYTASIDFASGWTEGLQVSTISSAYTTMTIQNDGRIGFFFEEYNFPKSGTEAYNMVYLPLSISDITKGVYTKIVDQPQLLYTVNLTATTNLNNVATFAAPYKTIVPTDVTAYIASSESDGTVTLTALDGAIPANEGVILVSESSSTANIYTSNVTEASISTNLLVGVPTETTLTEAEAANCYVLTKVNDYAVFRALDPSNATFAANKAYLKLDSSNARTLYNIVFEGTTGIDAVSSSKFQEAQGEIFDITGRRLNEMRKGINIVNGKKVIK